MAEYTGASIKNISMVKASDVFINDLVSVVGTVNVTALAIAKDGVLKIGTILRTLDGGENWETLSTPAYIAGVYDDEAEVYFEGHIYKSTVAANESAPQTGDWEDLGEWGANGILKETLTETKRTSVLVLGSAKGKYLVDLDSYLKVQLFKNKLFIK
jgi:hypothetical protein